MGCDVRGVPGAEGAGEAIARPEVPAVDWVLGRSGGAGLLDDIRRLGRSIL